MRWPVVLGGALALPVSAIAVAAGQSSDRVQRVGYFQQIFVVDRDGGAHRITSGRHSHGLPVWAPSSRRIAIVNDAHLEILAKRDGRVLHRFAGGPEGVSAATWSPDGRRLAYFAFYRAGAGRNGRLIVVSARGGERRVLARHAGGRVDWSRDGRTLYYLNGRESPYYRPQKPRGIYSIPSGGGTPRKLVSNVVGFRGESPDGRWLLFTRYGARTSVEEIWIARTDGTRQRLLAEESIPYYGWAPGRRGVYLVDRRHPLVISTSGKRHRLQGEINKRTFGWSPDGQRIAWEVEPALDPTRVESSRPNGTDARTLARFRARTFVEVDELVWSPDSRQLAVVASRHQGD